MLTPEERRDRIDRIARFPELLEALVSGLNNEQLHTQYLAHEWTVAQNVHHVADSHMNAYVRLKRILSEERPLLAGYDQDAWAGMADYDQPISVSLNLVRNLHTRWVAVLESLTVEQRERIGIHSENGEITPDSIADLYATHGEGHLDQIRRTLAAAPSAH